MQSNDWRMTVYILMKRYGVTQREIAREINYSVAQLSKIMNGKCEPRNIQPESIIYAVEKIAKRKGVFVDNR